MRKIKFVFLGLLALVSSSIFAGGCKDDINMIKAIYEVEVKQVYKKSKRDFVLYRNDSLLMQNSPSFGVTDVWNKTRNNRFKMTRYFTEHQRAVEYEPNDINRNGLQWSELYSLLPESVVQAVKKEKVEGKGCESLQTLKNKNIEVEWLTHYQLPKRLNVRKAKSREIWELKEIVKEPQMIKAYMTELEDYQTTDYADVGDNETDPFFRKMINLGFIQHGASGFYDSKGNRLSGHHMH